MASLLITEQVSAQDAVKIDPAIPAYKAVSGISGNLNSIGSDTLNNLMTLWAEGFKKMYPNVNIQIEGKGSTTAPPALIAGTAQLGGERIVALHAAASSPAMAVLTTAASQSRPS